MLRISHLQGLNGMLVNEMKKIIFFSIRFSFFPRIVQPVISILVNPIYLCFLRLNIISSNHADLLPMTTSSVMISNFDPQNIERRRQIALKALSERLSKTTESSRQQQQQQQQPLLPSTSSTTSLVEIEQNSKIEQN